MADEIVQLLSTSWDMWSGEPLPEACATLIEDRVLDQFSVAGDAEECGGKLRSLAQRHPEITGLRLKLPPLSGPESCANYCTMIEAVATAVAGW